MDSPNLSGWKLLWHLVCYAPKLYVIDSLFWLLIEGLFPAIPGLLIREFFNTLTASTHLDRSPGLIILLFLAAGVGQIIAIFLGRLTKTQHRFTISALVQRNFLASLLDRPGAQPLTTSLASNQPTSPSEIMSYFRDDVAQIEDNVVGTNEIGSAGVFAIGSLIVLLSVNAGITLLVFLPLVGIVFLLRQSSDRIQRYRRASRQATQQVTGLMGELLSAVQAVQLAGTKAAVMRYFQEMSDRRRRLMLKDQLLSALLESSFSNTASIGTGLILLLVALSLQSNQTALQVGDLALFVYYLSLVTSFFSFLGVFLTSSKQTEVSFERMTALLQVPDAPLAVSPLTLIAPQPLYLPPLFGSTPALPPILSPYSKPQNALQTLTIQDLSYCYPGSDRGIDRVSLTLRRGELVVITGQTGAGKTTLLRTILGLLPMQSGAIYWNDRVVDSPADFFVPPRSAYAPQVPSLFSDSLKDNLLLGLDEMTVDWQAAIAQTVLEPDLATMPEGLATLLGAKGVRLSGGQRLRVAAARALLRHSDLLVLDDLSSAIDVATEQLLWSRLFRLRQATSRPAQYLTTYLVVSHRRSLLQQADQVVVLKQGQVVAIGQFDEVCQCCEEMQLL